jgi:hypothetical protein
LLFLEKRGYLNQTSREHWSEYFLLAASVIPAMIATGFMPAWNVLPLAGWLAIAIVGAGIAGAMATPLWGRGLISGLIAGAGIFAGIWLYVAARTSMINSITVSKPELVIGAMAGWAPGLILFFTWARRRS